MIKKILFIFTLFTSLLMAANGAAIYIKCAKCHGENGKHRAFGKSSKIAGWKTEQTISVINIFKNMSKYDKFAKVMNKQVSKLSDDEIRAVAEYISRLR